MVLHASWKIMLALMIVNVIISEVDALTYVILSKVEEHIPNRELLVSENV
jgi:hypothetical protein